VMFDVGWRCGEIEGLSRESGEMRRNVAIGVLMERNEKDEKRKNVVWKEKKKKEKSPSVGIEKKTFYKTEFF
jgi:hypothetical protein